MEQAMIEKIVREVVGVLSNSAATASAVHGIPVGISSRHIHLSAEHIEILYGCGHDLTKQKDLSQIGQFAAMERVTLVGPKGVIQGVRVLGPVREISQVEISRTDGFSLGLVPPFRESGDIKKSPGIVVVGPNGAVTLAEGVICATRHIHMHDDDRRRFGVSNGDRVDVAVGGERGCIFKNVLVRVHPSFRLEFHIDTDEANGVGLSNGDVVTLPQCGEV
jgi:putative phosphotransacetylase